MYFSVLIASLCVVFCLTPICLYLGWLAAINRRQRPTLIPSVWDAVFLMFGLSGFIVFGGALIIESMLANHRIVPRDNWPQIAESFSKERSVWFILCGAYLTLVFSYAAVMLWIRRGSLTIYNIEEQNLDVIISSLFERLAIPAKRFGNYWSSSSPILFTNYFAPMRHITLTIVHEDRNLRAEIERGIRYELEKVSCEANPVSVWFTSASFYVLLFILFALIALAILIYR